MSVRYVLTPEAQAHVDEIGAYIAQDSVDAALKVYDALEEVRTIGNIKSFLRPCRASLDPTLRFRQGAGPFGRADSAT